MTIRKIMKAVELAREYHKFTDFARLEISYNPCKIENYIEIAEEDINTKIIVSVKISLDSNKLA